MTNFFVIFADGTSATLDDIPSQGSAVSDSQTRFLDASPSASIMVPVTLQFSLNGQPMEKKTSINVAAGR